MLTSTIFHRFLATIFVLFLSAIPAHAQLLMQPNISVSQARLIIDTIITECSRPGDLVTVTIAVVDRSGQPVMQVRADTSYTARTFRRNSIDWRDRTAGDSELSGQRALNHVVPLGGGAPIMVGDIPVGAVGVSGAGGGREADTACAELGIAAIADDLE